MPYIMKYGFLYECGIWVDELNLLLPFLGKCAKLLRMIVDL